MMITDKGFVLIVCLCFIAMVSSMALSALLMSQLSQKIAIAGQLQLKQLQQSKAQHLRLWQQYRPDTAVSSLHACPPELALSTIQRSACDWQLYTPVVEDLTAPSQWGSVWLSTKLELELLEDE